MAIEQIASTREFAMAKFHINPQKGPLPCTAAVGNCRYGSEQEHFKDFATAQRNYEKTLAGENQPFSTHKRATPVDDREKFFTPRLKKLDERLEKKGYDAVMAYAASSPQAHKALDSLIEARAWKSMRSFERLEKLNPFSASCKSPVTYASYKKLKQELDAYKDSTAVMVEAHLASPYYRSEAIEKDFPSIGNVKQVASYVHGESAWYTSRFDTIGGSDVGKLALHDFTAPDKVKPYDKKNYEELVTSKSAMVTPEQIQKSIDASELSRKGSLYRGSIWEDRIRDQYSREHPELKVYKTKGQYASKDRDWVRVNFDGLVSDREDGKPNGILEIKTGADPADWAEGVPLKYRAQTLYYLNATGFEYADVRVNLNDGDSMEFRLYSTDDVSPGTGITMNDYFTKRISPWFEEVKSNISSATVTM